MLEANTLKVSYGTRLVLNGVTLSLQSGTILGVIGPNGAGKTTLIRTLSGILIPQSGRVSVLGRDLSHMASMERARLIAVVPQARQLPPAFTAWETVLLGRTPYLNWLGQISGKDEEAVRLAMQHTDTLNLAERRVGELSGGEQQRLMLARALAQGAPILLLDEPTTHLDLQYQIELLDQVRQLAHHKRLAVVVALHDLNMVARYADQVALLVDGKLKALGTPDDVLNPALLSQVYRLPLQVISTGQGGPSYITPAN
jgi:iron complex transport system ATP-binding protein